MKSPRLTRNFFDSIDPIRTLAGHFGLFLASIHTSRNVVMRSLLGDKHIVSVWSPPAAAVPPQDRAAVHPRRSSVFRPDRAQPGAPCARAHFALAARSPVTSLHALFTRTVHTRYHISRQHRAPWFHQSRKSDTLFFKVPARPWETGLLSTAYANPLVLVVGGSMMVEPVGGRLSASGTIPTDVLAGRHGCLGEATALSMMPTSFAGVPLMCPTSRQPSSVRSRNIRCRPTSATG